MTWSSAQYRLFEDERTRPARDLLAHVRVEAPARVVDLGCGPGNSTELLAARWPDAIVTGIDSAVDMVETARKRLPALDFELADILAYAPAEAPDVIYANAVLQWLPDHLDLMTRTLDLLAPGGALAVQMPDNLGEPTHRLMEEAGRMGGWSARLAAAGAARTPLPPVETYYDALIGRATTVDIWRTTYVHPLADAGAVLEWVKGTGLRPYLAALEADEGARFLEHYLSLLTAAYRPRSDGRVLLRFPRLFVVAHR